MSPRPKRTRIMKEPPLFKGFVPIGVEYDNKSAVVLHFEEYEALILSDYESLNHDEAAEKLQVSRPTFTRIYSTARKKIATSLAKNIPVIVNGGNVKFDTFWYECSTCGCMFKSTDEKIESCPVCSSGEVFPVQEAGIGKPFNGKKRRSRGFNESCICPKCDYEVNHEPGKPCNSILCPNCDVRMLRKGSNHHLFVLNIRKNKKL